MKVMKVPNTTMIHGTGSFAVSRIAYRPSISNTARFWLKFCTAMEWPADSSVAPRCCSSAFIGTMKNPDSAPSRIISG